MEIENSENDFVIASNEIHLWCATYTHISSELQTSYLSLLSKHELFKYKSFHFDRDRIRYLITRSLVRSVLSKYYSMTKPIEWNFSTNLCGKPYIVNSLPNKISFNISHSNKYVVLVISRANRIGVDVENTKDIDNFMKICKKYFSSKEIDSLCLLKRSDQLRRFYDIWTLKESYIKAKGLGLSIPIDKFGFIFSGPNHIRAFFDKRVINDDYINWRFWLLQPNKRHKIAIAVESRGLNDYSIISREVTPDCKTLEVNYETTLRDNHTVNNL